ncbi:hypothetical protein DQ04_08821020 [Trypanosoma grayi]|uniref:hypothetical protein n=1 Tax=Trypanosoma grayi TaxID=71804 RepID=UPI0004F3F23F|nr:hypothetical protein DQ04_08821020 [Trypanosoma grayi]KEG07791.1 hypothetical protein DQ04_08821020 [Trypanosoma grayi]
MFAERTAKAAGAPQKASPAAKTSSSRQGTTVTRSESSNGQTDSSESERRVGADGTGGTAASVQGLERQTTAVQTEVEHEEREMRDGVETVRNGKMKSETLTKSQERENQEHIPGDSPGHQTGHSDSSLSASNNHLSVASSSETSTTTSQSTPTADEEDQRAVVERQEHGALQGEVSVPVAVHTVPKNILPSDHNTNELSQNQQRTMNGGTSHEEEKSTDMVTVVTPEINAETEEEEPQVSKLGPVPSVEVGETVPLAFQHGALMVAVEASGTEATVTTPAKVVAAEADKAMEYVTEAATNAAAALVKASAAENSAGMMLKSTTDAVESAGLLLSMAEKAARTVKDATREAEATATEKVEDTIQKAGTASPEKVKGATREAEATVTQKVEEEGKHISNRATDAKTETGAVVVKVIRKADGSSVSAWIRVPLLLSGALAYVTLCQ